MAESFFKTLKAEIIYGFSLVSAEKLNDKANDIKINRKIRSQANDCLFFYFTLICNSKSLSLRETSILLLMKKINRLRVVLAEKEKTGKWLGERLDKDPATVSRWCQTINKHLYYNCRGA